MSDTAHSNYPADEKLEAWAAGTSEEEPEVDGDEWDEVEWSPAANDYRPVSYDEAVPEVEE